MQKEHIIIIVMFIVVLGLCGAVYKFYFEPQLAIYSRDLARVQELDQKFNQLKDTFGGSKPDQVVAEWRGQVQPWTDALFARAPYFNMSDFLEIEPIPEREMLKFYYAEQSKTMLDKLQETIRTHTPYCNYPNPTRFGAGRADDFRKMTEDQVRMGLRLIQFGGSMVKMLLKAKATEISHVEIWPKRLEYGDLLVMWTTGLAFKMTMKDLVRFIDEDLRLADRYFDINAFSIQNKTLRTPQEPQLEVKMLLTQAVFVQEKAQAEVSAAPGAGPGMRSTTTAPPPPPPDAPVTGFQKFMKWLKFNFWPF